MRASFFVIRFGLRITLGGSWRIFMLTKIYLVLLSVAVILMVALTYLSYGWLQSIGDPQNAIQNYQFYSGISWSVLWVCFLALVIVANVLLWKTRKAWALWASLLFFLTFIITQTFWLENAFFNFVKENTAAESKYFVTPFLGITISIVATIGIFFDQFILVRMRDKMLEKDGILTPSEANDEEDA